MKNSSRSSAPPVVDSFGSVPSGANCVMFRGKKWFGRDISNSNSNSSPISSFKDRKIDYSVLTRTFITNPVEYDDLGNIKSINLGNSNKGVGRGRGRRKNSKEIIFPKTGIWTIKEISISNGVKPQDINVELVRLKKVGEIPIFVGKKEKTEIKRGKCENIWTFDISYSSKVNNNKIKESSKEEVKSKPAVPIKSVVKIKTNNFKIVKTKKVIKKPIKVVRAAKSKQIKIKDNKKVVKPKLKVKTKKVLKKVVKTKSKNKKNKK